MSYLNFNLSILIYLNEINPADLLQIICVAEKALQVIQMIVYVHAYKKNAFFAMIFTLLHHNMFVGETYLNPK